MVSKDGALTAGIAADDAGSIDAVYGAESGGGDFVAAPITPGPLIDVMLLSEGASYLTVDQVQGRRSPA